MTHHCIGQNLWILQGMLGSNLGVYRAAVWRLLGGRNQSAESWGGNNLVRFLICPFRVEQPASALKVVLIEWHCRQVPDTLVHACLYFIAPTGHGLKPLDIDFMRRIHNKVTHSQTTHPVIWGLLRGWEHHISAKPLHNCSRQAHISKGKHHSCDWQSRLLHTSRDWEVQNKGDYGFFVRVVVTHM